MEPANAHDYERNGKDEIWKDEKAAALPWKKEDAIQTAQKADVKMYVNEVEVQFNAGM